MADPIKKGPIRYWRPPNLEGLELMRASFTAHAFSRHAHEGYAVGVIEKGALGFHYRGENVVAPAGSINLAIPDEPHDGRPAVESGWTYRMFYLEARCLISAESELSRKQGQSPFFPTGVIHDPALAAAVHRLHLDLETGAMSALAGQSRLLIMLTQLIRRHSPGSDRPLKSGRERGVVKKLKEYISSCHQEEITLRDLSEVAGLSPFHLIRVFRKETGLTPHAYLIQQRTRQAQKLIGRGYPISFAAAEVGFFDQSHLTRHFKAMTGLTPGQYRNFIQDPTLSSLWIIVGVNVSARSGQTSSAARLGP